MLKTVTNYLNGIFFLNSHSFNFFGMHFSFSGVIIFSIFLCMFLLFSSLLLRGRNGFLWCMFLISLGLFGFTLHYNLQNNAKYRAAYKDTSMQVMNWLMEETK